MIEDLNKWAKENGYLEAAVRPDGKIVAVLAGIANGQIIVGDEFGVEERYSYPDLSYAIAHYTVWEHLGFPDEPMGWIRHQPSNRRREGGDPSKEIVRE